MTKKITIAVSVVLVSILAGFLVAMGMYKLNIEKLGECLKPFAGQVSVKDKDGVDQQVTVVVAQQIGACIESN